MIRERIGVFGLAGGLTVWFALVNTLVLAFQLARLPADVVPFVQVLVIYSYFLLPVRWAMVLTLLIRRVRAKRGRWPEWLRMAAATAGQMALGVLSLAGFWALWNDTGKTGDRIAGFVMHVVMPCAIVAALARTRSIAPGRQSR